MLADRTALTAILNDIKKANTRFLKIAEHFQISRKAAYVAQREILDGHGVMITSQLQLKDCKSFVQMRR